MGRFGQDAQRDGLGAASGRARQVGESAAGCLRRLGQAKRSRRARSAEDLHGGSAQARGEAAARLGQGALSPARLERGFGALTLALNSVGTLWIFALMFLICADVAGRYLFGAPIKGAAEMVGYSIVAAVFLQMASTLRAGRFTRVELLFEPMQAKRPAAAAGFDSLFNLLGAAVFAVAAWGTWPKLRDAWLTDEITGTPGVFTFTVWPFIAV